MKKTFIEVCQAKKEGLDHVLVCHSAFLPYPGNKNIMAQSKRVQPPSEPTLEDLIAGLTLTERGAGPGSQLLPVRR